MKKFPDILISGEFASSSVSAVNTPSPTAGVGAFLDVLNAGNGDPLQLHDP